MADQESYGLYVSSLYRHAYAVQEDDGTVVLMLPERLPHEDLDGTTLHIVSEGERVYDLANLYYKRTARSAVDMWDVIAQFQPTPILDPSVPLKVGTEVYIPPDDYVEEVAYGPSLTEAPVL